MLGERRSRLYVSLALGLGGLCCVLLLLRLTFITDYFYHATVKDPQRTIPGGDNIVSPADGTVLYSLHLEPDLTFNPEKPAKLEFHFSQASTEDLSEIERSSIFRQEVDGGPYVCVPSVLDVLGSTMQADVNGFTRYALAIGR